MEATEVKDLIEEAIEHDHEKAAGSKTSTAIYISLLAAVLAVVSVLGSNAGKEMMANAIDASDTYNYYQAKTQRQVSLRVSADELELLSEALPDAAKAKAAAKVAEYRKTADRMDSAEDKNSRPALLDKARAAEQRRDHAAAQDPYYDFAEALLQIAIVLASVFVITELSFVLWASWALAGVGLVLALDGFTQIIPLPFL